MWWGDLSGDGRILSAGSREGSDLATSPPKGLVRTTQGVFAGPDDNNGSQDHLIGSVQVWAGPGGLDSLRQRAMTVASVRGSPSDGEIPKNAETVDCEVYAALRQGRFCKGHSMRTKFTASCQSVTPTQRVSSSETGLEIKVLKKVFGEAGHFSSLRYSSFG
jgi:hypothetical protein